MRSPRLRRRALDSLVVALLALFVGLTQGLLGVCGPFTDTPSDPFCVFILEVFYLGITTGTTPTTYDPTGNVNRTQMAAFLSRTVDGVLKRGSRRAAVNQFWTLKKGEPFFFTFGSPPVGLPASDGADIWAPSQGSGLVVRVRGSDGRMLETWTGATGAAAALVGFSRIFVTGSTTPGTLYVIYPSASPGSVATVATNLGNSPRGLTFDGSAIWTANVGGSVSTVTVVTLPPTVSTVTAGFVSPLGALYDGSNVWVTDNSAGTLLKLDAAAGILQTVSLGTAPRFPIFDGANIWVPWGNAVSVVRASSGVVVATLTGNGLTGPYAAAFDGQRILVTNSLGDSVSLWKASDLTPIGIVPTGAGTAPFGGCSDGISFWLTYNGFSGLSRF